MAYEIGKKSKRILKIGNAAFFARIFLGCLLFAETCVLSRAVLAADSDCSSDAVTRYVSYRHALADHRPTAQYFNAHYISDLMNKKAGIKSEAERNERLSRYILTIDHLQMEVDDPTGAYVRCDPKANGHRHVVAIFKTTASNAVKSTGFVEVTMVDGLFTNVALLMKPEELEGAQQHGVPYAQLEFTSIP